MLLKTRPNWSFDAFKTNSKIPKGQFKNDEEGELGHDDELRSPYGLPDVRFGGGLFLNYNGFSQAVKNKLQYPNSPGKLVPGIFSSSNFMSIDHKMSSDRGTKFSLDQESNEVSQKQLDENNFKNEIHATSTKEPVGLKKHPVPDSPTIYKTFQRQHYSFSNVSATHPDSIVNKDDFNLTPNYMDQIDPNPSKISNNKETFKTLFNEELFDWYWTTWYQQYKGGEGIALAKSQLSS